VVALDNPVVRVQALIRLQWRNWMTGVTYLLALCMAYQMPDTNSHAVNVIQAASKAVGRSTVNGPVGWKMSGRLCCAGNTIHFTQYHSDSDLARVENTWQERGLAKSEVLVVCGGKGWSLMAGKTTEMPTNELAVFDDMFYRSRVTQLKGELTGKEFTLTQLPGRKVDKEDCTGVRVRCAMREDIDLYFSDTTHLLRQVVTKRLGPDGKQYDMTETRSAYKKFDGCHIATKVVREIGTLPVFEESIDKAEAIPLNKIGGLFEKP
jgi:hypothetical protein